MKYILIGLIGFLLYRVSRWVFLRYASRISQCGIGASKTNCQSYSEDVRSTNYKTIIPALVMVLGMAGVVLAIVLITNAACIF